MIDKGILFDRGVFFFGVLFGLILVVHSFNGQARSIEATRHARTVVAELEAEHGFTLTAAQEEEMFHRLDRLQRAWSSVAALGFLSIGVGCVGLLATLKRSSAT